MVKEANIPSTALETEENGLIIHISDMSLSMNAHWRYEQKKWSVHDMKFQGVLRGGGRGAICPLKMVLPLGLNQLLASHTTIEIANIKW